MRTCKLRADTAPKAGRGRFSRSEDPTQSRATACPAMIFGNGGNRPKGGIVNVANSGLMSRQPSPSSPLARGSSSLTTTATSSGNNEAQAPVEGPRQMVTSPTSTAMAVRTLGGIQAIAAPWREDFALRVARQLEKTGTAKAPVARGFADE